MTIGFVDKTALDKDRAEDLAVVIPTFIGEPEEGEEHHRTKYGSPTTDLSGDVEGAILDPDYLRKEIDTAKVGVCIRPASPRRKGIGSGVEIYLEHRYRCSAHQFHTSERHQTEISAGRQRFI